MTQDTATAPQIDPGIAARKGKRNRLFLIFGVVLVVLAVIWLLYYVLIGSRHVETDDAYVNADTAQLTALISGAITSDPVGEMQKVQKGQVLATIDDSDFVLAVDKAKADLGSAERKVKQYYAANDARGSDVARAEAQLASARADLQRAQVEAGRRKNLSASGAVSGDELTQSQTTLASMQAALKAAEAGVALAKANAASSDILISGTDVEGNPEVAAARAHLNQAELDLSRTQVRAPVDGLVAKKNIEIGQRVQAGAALMSIVPIQSAFVDANFKEVQLRKIRVGSKATLTSDVYGSSVKFHGTVIGVAGGSGAAFALIPAQNATGNWIKVVQRVPVRIQLDPKELEKHPLRVGLSMKVDVDATSPAS